MKKRHPDRRVSLALATVCIAIALPTAANAACPAVGASRLIGSCAPREFCQKQVVVERRQYNSGPGFLVDVYHRTYSGWQYYGWAHYPCSQWP